MTKNFGRPPSIDTHRRRLAKLRDDLTWALRFPHPAPGRQRQRLATLEHKIVSTMAKIKDLEQETTS